MKKDQDEVAHLTEALLNDHIILILLLNDVIKKKKKEQALLGLTDEEK